MHVTSAARDTPLLLARPLRGDELAGLIGPRLRTSDDRSLLVYIHVPFCSSKCTFCNWVSDIPVPQLRAGASVRSDYTAAVCRQIRALAAPLNDLRYEPVYVYWGGGTPSILSGDEIEAIVETLGASFDLSRVREHTIETSPETLTADKLTAMRRAGIDRVSMGVQSFDDQELRRAARAHSAAVAEHAVALLRDAGYANVNLDLIAGFPEQTLDVLKRTLDKTIALAPEHVTVYVYRAETNTVMARQIHDGHRSARSLAENLEAYECARDRLEEAGYVEYTVGYFARSASSRFKGEEYYFGLEGDYVGFGCGGESILGHHSLVNPSNRLEQFLASPSDFSLAEQFSPLRLEAVLRALRLTILTEGGIEYRRFERLFGFPFSVVRDDPYVKGLLQYLRYCGADFVETGERLFVTEASRSRSYIVALQRKFYPAKPETPAIGRAQA